MKRLTPEERAKRDAERAAEKAKRKAERAALSEERAEQRKIRNAQRAKCARDEKRDRLWQDTQAKIANLQKKLAKVGVHSLGHKQAAEFRRADLALGDQLIRLRRGYTLARCVPPPVHPTPEQGSLV